MSGAAWLDKLAVLRQGCAQLGSGQLRHAADFALRDAMQAVEIGDQKTDSGRAAVAAYLLDEGLRLGRIPRPSALTVAEQTRLMDSLLALLVEWLDGRMAATQSLFTCAYLLDTELWRHDDGAAELYAFCKLLLQLAHELLGQIVQTGCFDAEDFVPHLCNARVEQPEGTQQLLADNADLQSLPLALPAEPAPAELRLLRVQLVYYLLQLMSGEFAALNKAMLLLQQLQQTANAADDEPAVKRHPLAPHECLPAGVLQVYLPSRMDPPLLPGPALKEPALPRYVHYLQQLLTEIFVVCTQVNSGQYRIGDWVQGTDIRELTVPARSLVELHADRLAQALTHSFAAFAVPGDYIATEQVQQFAGTLAARHYRKLTEIYIYNRARQRRAIGSALLQQLPVIQQLAVALDRRLADSYKLLALKYRYARYFEAWSVDQTLQWMIRYLEEGIVGELFVGEELVVVYWYLDYLYGKLIELRTQICTETQAVRAAEHALQQRQASRRGAKKRGGARGGQSASSSSLSNCPSEHLIDLVRPQIHRLLCQASRQVLLAVSLQGRLQPSSPLNPLSFPKRFRAFANIRQPAPLHYDWFRDTTKNITADQAPTLLALASQSFVAAKTEISKHAHFPDRHNLLKLCVANSVQIELTKRRTEPPTGPIACDFANNCPYPLLFL